MYILTSDALSIFEEYNLTPSGYSEPYQHYICEISPALYALLVLKYTPLFLPAYTKDGLYFSYIANCMHYRSQVGYERDKAFLEAQCTS